MHFCEPIYAETFEKINTDQRPWILPRT